MATTKCRECDGTGRFTKHGGDDPCPWCDSTGKVEILYDVTAHGHNGDSSFSEPWTVETTLAAAKKAAEKVMRTTRYDNLHDGVPTIQWMEIFGPEFDESLGLEERDGELVWSGQ